MTEAPDIAEVKARLETSLPLIDKPSGHTLLFREVAQQHAADLRALLADHSRLEARVGLGTLREANAARQVEWANGEAVSLLFRATELGGECGEVLNVCKKIERERQGWRGSRATIQDLADELADVVICADLLALTEGIDLEAAVVRKFNATSEKVGLPHRFAPALTPANTEETP